MSTSSAISVVAKEERVPPLEWPEAGGNRDDASPEEAFGGVQGEGGAGGGAGGMHGGGIVKPLRCSCQPDPCVEEDAARGNLGLVRPRPRRDGQPRPGG